MTEVVVRSCSVKKVFLEISQNSGENTSARASFLIKLQASQVFSCVATSELQIYLAFHRRYLHISFVQNQNRFFFYLDVLASVLLHQLFGLDVSTITLERHQRIFL